MKMRIGAWVVAMAAVATGCLDEGFEEETEESIDSTEQEIINGNTMNPEGLFFVDVRHGGPGNTSTTRPYNICTGTLIRNDAVLTARHCVTYNRTISGAIDTTMSSFDLVIGSQTSGAREVIDLGGDAALIITEKFFNIGGWNVDSSLPIFAGASSSLVGTSLFCPGYGLGNASDPSTAEILRYANLTPSSANTSIITYPMNASGQILWKGDSGGTCFFTGGTGFQVTGINSTCSSSSGPCQQVSPETYRTGANNALAARGRGFIHTATSSNISGHITTIDHPDTNDKPNAIVSVTANWNPIGSGGVYNNHHFGIYFSGGRWRIFNQDFAAMPANASFNVSVGSGFVQRTTSANTVSNSTILDHPSLNNNPNAAFIVTPHWNPPGSSGVYNNHGTGVWYDGSRWNIYNQDNASMPLNTGFTVRIDRSFSVRATTGTVAGNWVYLDDPNLNGHPEARVFATPNFNPNGLLSGYMQSPIGVWYDTGMGKWAIYRQDLGTMSSTAGFNVLYRP